MSTSQDVFSPTFPADISSSGNDSDLAPQVQTNGELFRLKLIELGWPPAKSCRPGDFSWLFENRAALPFLNWFMTCVDKDNVLTTEELERYAQLERDGKVVSVAEHGALEVVKEREEVQAVEEILAESDRIKAKTEVTKKRSKRMDAMAEYLSSEVNRVSENIQKHEARKATAEKEYVIYKERLSSTFLELGEAVSDLQDAVESVSADVFANCANSEQMPSFMSLIDLRPYLEEEKNLIDSLTQINKKVISEPGKFCECLEESEEAICSDYPVRLREIVCNTTICNKATLRHMVQQAATEAVEKEMEKLVANGESVGDSLIQPTDATLTFLKKFEEDTLPKLLEDHQRVILLQVLKKAAQCKLQRFKCRNKIQEYLVNAALDQRARLEITNLLLNLEDNQADTLISMVKETNSWINDLAAWYRKQIDLQDSHCQRQGHQPKDLVNTLERLMKCENSGVLKSVSSMMSQLAALKDKQTTNFGIIAKGNCKLRQENDVLLKCSFPVSLTRPILLPPLFHHRMALIKTKVKEVENVAMKDTPPIEQELQAYKQLSSGKTLWITFFQKPELMMKLHRKPR